MLVLETPEGEAVAAHLALYGKGSTIGWSSARNPAFSLTGSNALLYYNEFLDLQSRNFEYMNGWQEMFPAVRIISWAFLQNSFLTTV